MKLLKNTLAILLFFFLFTNNLIFAQTAQVEQPFLFTDEFNNTQEIIVGYDPFGTEGLDPDLGEEYIPQVSPGNFGVRSILPTDTNITLVKDIRFGCYWATGYEHLIELSYAPNSTTISIDWEWSTPPYFFLIYITFISPENGQTIESFNWGSDPSFFQIPALLNKIKMQTLYDGTLSSEDYELYSPNGGEILESGQTFEITWWNNQLGMYYDIEFSSDAGNTWSIIDTVSITQSSYEWTVPPLNSEYCLIRVGNYPCVYDQSDSFFTIIDPVFVDENRNFLTTFSLSQNYPNPFNPSTKIKFTVPTPPTSSPLAKGRTEEGFVTLKVYDVLGNEIVTLVNEEKQAGEYEVEFNTESNIRHPASGIYFYQLKAGSFVETKKMILLK